MSDNTILAYEISQFMMLKRKGRDVHMALTLDMRKAYNRVECPFLEGIMKKMGFKDIFLQLTMKFVSMVSYRFRLNGDP
jgi:hypothetical protein